uniref:Uncharacterized protein n=1 Tax=Oryza meridionalis TaxID=40149 RepID=A0A0E0EIH5_9ORYZ
MQDRTAEKTLFAGQVPPAKSDSTVKNGKNFLRHKAEEREPHVRGLLGLAALPPKPPILPSSPRRRRHPPPSSPATSREKLSGG